MTRGILLSLLAITTVACGDQFSAADNNNANANVPESCGDGVRDADEACDGSALGGETCEGLGFVGGTLACAADCQLDVSACVIPAGCGNHVLDPGEECDGANLGGQTCEILGYDGGTLGCSLACRFDTASCVSSAVCGNGARELPGEACDGADLGGQTCQSQGFDGGTLACDETCQLDLTGCANQPVCGNGQVESGEECDGANLGGTTCQGLGFDGGQLTCNAGCLFDSSGCTSLDCGDGVIDLGEECDGTNFGGETCQSLGYGGGQLACTANCRLSVTGCTGDPCGDGQIDPGEACDGADLGGQTCLGLGYPGGQLACAPDCTLDVSGCTPAAEDCDNGIDDDLNGACDCADSACTMDPYCMFSGGPEASCTDGVDNDHDCLVDCADPDCAGDPACGGGGEICDNGVDDDGDFLVDCLDPECAGHPACASPVCAPHGSITCGGVVTGTTVGGPTRITNYPQACTIGPDDGPEAYFLFSNTGGLFTTQVTVDLVAAGSFDLDLIVVGVSNGDCDVAGDCIASSQSPSGTEQVVFTATLGASYYLIVDGFNGAAGGFTLSVSCQ